MEKSKFKVRLGDYVVVPPSPNFSSERAGHPKPLALWGRVYAIDSDSSEGFESNESEQWFEFQIHIGNCTEWDLDDRWIRVLVDGGGSIYVPERRCVVVEPFVFSNSYEEYYFGKPEPETPAKNTGVDTASKKMTDEERRMCIRDIESLFPADSHEDGGALLFQAICSEWRSLPDRILMAYWNACYNRDGGET